MGYRNAQEIFPEGLLKQIQRYVSGETIYVPAREEKKAWGETSDQRLRARPKERGFTTDEAIRPHIEYNQWIGKNRGKYQLFIDTENQTPDETAEAIAAFIMGLAE